MCPHNCVTNLPKPRQKLPGKKTMCPLVKASVEAGLWLVHAKLRGMLENAQKGPPMIYAFFECSRKIQSRFNYVCETVEKVVFYVYNWRYL